MQTNNTTAHTHARTLQGSDKLVLYWSKLSDQKAVYVSICVDLDIIGGRDIKPPILTKLWNSV